jgi:hypothetical protein
MCDPTKGPLLLIPVRPGLHFLQNLILILEKQPLGHLELRLQLHPNIALRPRDLLNEVSRDVLRVALGDVFDELVVLQVVGVLGLQLFGDAVERLVEGVADLVQR